MMSRCDDDFFSGGGSDVVVNYGDLRQKMKTTSRGRGGYSPLSSFPQLLTGQSVVKQESRIIGFLLYPSICLTLIGDGGTAKGCLK